MFLPLPMPLLTGLPNSNKTQPYSVWWYGGRRGRRSKGLKFLPSPFLGELAILELEFALLSLQQEDFEVFALHSPASRPLSLLSLSLLSLSLLSLSLLSLFLLPLRIMRSSLNGTSGIV